MPSAPQWRKQPGLRPDIRSRQAAGVLAAPAPEQHCGRALEEAGVKARGAALHQAAPLQHAAHLPGAALPPHGTV